MGLIVRLAPGTMIRDMLVSGQTPESSCSPVDNTGSFLTDVQTYSVLQHAASTNNSELGI